MTAVSHLNMQVANPVIVGRKNEATDDRLKAMPELS
jgi:hypothetical protein